MAIKLKQSTASQEIPLGYFVDSTDGNTEETALSIANTDIKLWKMGATTLANKNSGGATHISNGIYYAVLDATDTNTLGALIVFVHVSGALAVRVECEVLPATVYDAWISGTDNFDVSVTQWNGTNVASPHTAGYPIVTVKDGTGTGEIDTSSGRVLADTVYWNGSAVATPTVAGVPEVDITHIGGSVISTTTAQLGVNVVQISGDSTSADNLEAYTDGTTPQPVNVTQLSGDSTAADNAESFFDGTGYAGTNNVIPTVTTVNGLAANTITATSIASDAITAAKIATGAIDADALAADAGAELADAIADEVYEGSYTLRQFIRLFAAMLLGEASGGGTTTIVMRDASDTKTRITFTVDSSGNRSAAVYDAT